MSLDQIRERAEIDLEEEERRTMPPGREPLNFWGTTLENMMEQQGKQFSGFGAPLAFLFLLQELHKMDGTELEGIFRISCDAAEILALREGLQYGNIGYLPTSAHVPAALMKKWLRELE